jgi:hypothetical protein
VKLARIKYLILVPLVAWPFAHVLAAHPDRIPGVAARLAFFGGLLVFVVLMWPVPSAHWRLRQAYRAIRRQRAFLAASRIEVMHAADDAAFRAARGDSAPAVALVEMLAARTDASEQFVCWTEDLVAAIDAWATRGRVWRTIYRIDRRTAPLWYATKPNRFDTSDIAHAEAVLRSVAPDIADRLLELLERHLPLDTRLTAVFVRLRLYTNPHPTVAGWRRAKAGFDAKVKIYERVAASIAAECEPSPPVASG